MSDMCPTLLVIISTLIFVKGQRRLESGVSQLCPSRTAYVENYSVYRCSDTSNLYQAGCSIYSENGPSKFVALESINMADAKFDPYVLPHNTFDCEALVYEPSLLESVENVELGKCFDCRQTDSRRTKLVLCIPASSDWSNVRSMKLNSQRCSGRRTGPRTIPSEGSRTTFTPNPDRGSSISSTAFNVLPQPAHQAPPVYPGWYGNPNRESTKTDPETTTAPEVSRNTDESNVPNVNQPMPPDQHKVPLPTGTDDSSSVVTTEFHPKPPSCPDKPLEDVYILNENGHYWKSMLTFDTVYHNDIPSYVATKEVCLFFETIVNNEAVVTYPEISDLIGFANLSLGFSKLTIQDRRMLYRYQNPILTTLYILIKLRECNFYADLERKFVVSLINTPIASDCPTATATINNVSQKAYQPDITNAVNLASQQNEAD